MNVHIHDFLAESETVLWDLWYPEAGATGVPFARGRLNPTEVLWVEDRWPEAADQGNLVILPGGEVGTLLEWWNAADGSEWRWKTEFYNHS